MEVDEGQQVVVEAKDDGVDLGEYLTALFLDALARGEKGDM